MKKALTTYPIPIVLTFLVLVFLSSCVENRKVLFLQKGEVNKKGMPTDTVLRSYNLVDYQYKIQPQDILYIRFQSLTAEEFDFFSKNQTQNMGANQANLVVNGDLVDDNGEVPFPVVGKVKVSEMTVFEAQEKLQKIADQYLESPVVKVRLINFRITVLGEVNKEGTVVLNTNRVSLMEAIGWAGGFTDLADRADVKLIRQQNGKARVQYINLLDEEFVNSPNYFVNQSDILIVPPLKQRPFRKYFGPNLALVTSSLALLLLTINFIQAN